jgi:hypothetical protein
MPKHASHNTAGHGKGSIAGSPQWAPRQRSVTYQMNLLREITVGQPFDREPCPHVLVTHDTIPDLARPDDPHRARIRRTLTPCQRPGGHLRAQKVISVPASFSNPHEVTTVVVPDEAARLHSDHAGRTW